VCRIIAFGCHVFAVDFNGETKLHETLLRNAGWSKKVYEQKSKYSTLHVYEKRWRFFAQTLLANVSMLCRNLCEILKLCILWLSAAHIPMS